MCASDAITFNQVQILMYKFIGRLPSTAITTTRTWASPCASVSVCVRVVLCRRAPISAECLNGRQEDSQVERNRREKQKKIAADTDSERNTHDSQIYFEHFIVLRTSFSLCSVPAIGILCAPIRNFVVWLELLERPLGRSVKPYKSVRHTTHNLCIMEFKWKSFHLFSFLSYQYLCKSWKLL